MTLGDRIVDSQRRGPRRRSPDERANALDDLAGAVAVVEDVVDCLAVISAKLGITLGAAQARRRVLRHLTELLLDEVQALHCACVVVVVMRGQELLRKSLELRRVERQRFHLVDDPVADGRTM